MKPINYTRLQMKLDNKLIKLISVDLWNKVVGNMAIRNMPIWRSNFFPELSNHPLYYRY